MLGIRGKMSTEGMKRTGRFIGMALLGGFVAALPIGYGAGISIFFAKILGCVLVGGVVTVMISWVVSSLIRGERLRLATYLGLSVLLGGFFGCFWAAYFKIDLLFPIVFGFWAGFVVACAAGKVVLE